MIEPYPHLPPQNISDKEQHGCKHLSNLGLSLLVLQVMSSMQEWVLKGKVAGTGGLGKFLDFSYQQFDIWNLGLDAMFHCCLLFLTLILCWFQGL
jgi:hypothetical protein